MARTISKSSRASVSGSALLTSPIGHSSQLSNIGEMLVPIKNKHLHSMRLKEIAIGHSPSAKRYKTHPDIALFSRRLQNSIQSMKLKRELCPVPFFAVIWPRFEKAKNPVTTQSPYQVPKVLLALLNLVPKWI